MTDTQSNDAAEHWASLLQEDDGLRAICSCGWSSSELTDSSELAVELGLSHTSSSTSST